jgi:predicted aldo/keto reductase-like oxidoreductase
VRYRRFGGLDWDVSVLGLGVAGLPVGDPDSGGAAESEGVRMIRHAIDHGVNYLDLGCPYDMVRQESLAQMAGCALKDGFRERVKISLTVPVSMSESARDFDRYLDTQMEWLRTGSIDFCVLGGVNRENWPRIQETSFLKTAERAISDGRVRSLGFAFHDHFQILRQVLKAYEGWAFAQFQFSYMDASHDPGAPGLAHAADQGLAVVVTEPLKGGRLAKESPESVRMIWAGVPQVRSLPDWGLRFVWNHSAVSTVVCGVGSMDQLLENVALADKAEAGALTVREELTINRVRDAYNQLSVIDCASCRPCMPCPRGIDVPRIFEIYNDAIIYGDVRAASSVYRRERHSAEECTECGLCERKCCRRERLPIIAWLKTAHDLLGENEG